MLALFLEYIAVDLLIGLGVGLVGGIFAAFAVPMRFNRRPSTVMDIFAYLLFLCALLIALIFPLTMYVTFLFTFYVVWILLPFLLGIGRKKRVEPVIDEDIEEAVASVSPEGRAAVLDQMGIVPL